MLVPPVMLMGPFDPTEQSVPVKDEPLSIVRLVTLALSAMMQLSSEAFSSAQEDELTFILDPAPSARARRSGKLLVTATSTALLPLPVGEVTTLAVAAVEDRPFSWAILETVSAGAVAL